MTAVSVINAVRNRLGDIKEERWDDATLLLYVSLCQNDICMFTHFHRKAVNITLYANTLVYNLPSDCIVANRFEYLNKLIPVESRNTIDAKTAKFPCILKDNLAFNKMEFKLGEEFDSLAVALENVYGLVTDGTGLLDSFGVVTEVITDPTNTEPAIDNVVLYYTATPPLLAMVDNGNGELSLPTDNLLVPDIWFQAFLHFVCAMALQDDNDANNIQRGELEASKYSRILEHIKKVSSKDFTSNMKTKLQTRIRKV